MWRLDHAAAAGVDGDVVTEARIAEEHQVAGPHVAERHRCALLLLDGRAVVHADADLRVAVHRETGAVEPARARAAPDVGDPEVALCDGDDLGVAGAVGVERRRQRAAERQLRRAPGGQGGLPEQALDLGLEALRHPLELALQGQDLVLLRRTLRDQRGRDVLVRLELEAAVLDVAAIGGDGLDGVDVAVADAVHHVELRDQLVEGVGSEEDVDDADVARLVDVLGAYLELLVGRLEVLPGDVQEMLVLLDLQLDAAQPARSLVVFLNGHRDLRVDRLEPGLNCLETGFLVGDRRRGRSCGEEEGEEAGAEDEGESRAPCAVHTLHSIESSRARVTGGTRVR